MTGGRIQQVVLFLTHRLDDDVLERFASIDVPQDCEKRILLDGRSYRGELPADLPIVKFDFVQLIRRGYQPVWPGCLLPGSNHFPVVEYAASHPQYEFVWVIEYDVIFTGRWATLFEGVPAGADLVTTKIRRFDQDPNWPWWKIRFCRPLKPDFPSPRQFIASFNPIYRLSHVAALFLRARFLDGWCGHHEVAMATLLHCMNFRVEELGGSSEFTPEERRGRYYRIDETMRWRPKFDAPSDEWPPDTLYHPVALRRSSHTTEERCAIRSPQNSEQDVVCSQAEFVNAATERT